MEKLVELREGLETKREELELDFLGVAPTDRFKNAPKSHRPTDLLPATRSVIAVGLKIAEGVCEANHRAFEEEGLRHEIYSYEMHGYVSMNDKLNESVRSLASWLERRGHKSLPIPASSPKDGLKLMGTLSNRHAAVTAGLAEFGWQGLAVTEEAGPRVRWATVLTEASLPEDQLSEEGLCQDCRRCAEVCPVGAIPLEESVELEIDGKSYNYSALNKWLCLTGTSGWNTKTGREEEKLNLPPSPEAEDYLQALREESYWGKSERVGSMCGRCIIECPIGEPSYLNLST